VLHPLTKRWFEKTMERAESVGVDTSKIPKDIPSTVSHGLLVKMFAAFGEAVAKPSENEGFRNEVRGRAGCSENCHPDLYDNPRARGPDRFD